MNTAVPPRIAVVGGGIAGLAAAHRLIELGRERRQPIDVRLLEAAPRLGGTIVTEHGGGFVLDGGPDSFLSEKPAALRLCERLGITDRLVGTREEFRRTFIVHDGRLHALPEGFLLLAPTRLWPFLTTPLFSWPGKLRMGLDLILPRGARLADESLASFVRRRLGGEALERVAQPLVGGIYTADPERLSLAATMPRFLAMEREQRSVVAAMWRQSRLARANATGSGARWSLFLSFDQGMQVLVDNLARRLPEGVVRCGSPVRSLARTANSGWTLDGGEECGAVVLATPAFVSARLLSALDPHLASELEGIPYASSATVTLAYRREDVPHPLDGFGFVVPAIEKRRILACTFSNLKYPGRAPAGFAVLRSFVGGALQPELFDLDDAAMLHAVRGEMADLLGIRADPVLSRIHRYPRAMPQYEVGHLQRVERVRRLLAAHCGLQLAGSAYEGVGIPDCIASGERAAEAVPGALLGQGPHWS
jgi:protoporphyrinogen/coproporphyrinogen III oxidase